MADNFGVVFEEIEFYTNNVGLSFEFRGGSISSRMNTVLITGYAPSNSGRPTDKTVWFDTYQGNGDDVVSVWGHLHPDAAEQIGLALIAAARVARGE